jgi:NADH-quinone oxidoreductase subunit M
MGEVMIFFGAFQSSSVNGLIPVWMAIMATSGLLLGAAYYLWTIQRMFYGAFSVKNVTADLTDLNSREYSMLLPLALFALVFGVLPQLLLNYINPFASEFVNNLFQSGTTLTP